MHLLSFIQQTRNMKTSAWVLKKGNNKGKILIHINSHLGIVNTAANNAGKVQNVVQKKDRLLAESQSIHSLEYRKTVSNVRQSHLRTRTRNVGMHLCFPWIILSLHTKADGLQNQKPHVGRLHHIFTSGGGGIEMLTRFHGRPAVPRKSKRFKGLLTLKERDARPAGRRWEGFDPPSCDVTIKLSSKGRNLIMPTPRVWKPRVRTMERGDRGGRVPGLHMTPLQKQSLTVAWGDDTKLLAGLKGPDGNSDLRLDGARGRHLQGVRGRAGRGHAVKVRLLLDVFKKSLMHGVHPTRPRPQPRRALMVEE